MKLIKTKLCVCLLLLAASGVRAETNDLTSLLQRGLFEEQANRNLTAAISNYQTIVAKFDQNRQLAATAVFRIGECYRMEGKTNEAATQYRRMLRDFSDETALAVLSRQNLVGLGMSTAPATDTISPSDASRQEQIKQGIKLFEDQVAMIQKQITNSGSPDGLLSIQQKLLDAKRLLSGLQSPPTDSSASGVATDEEDHEIRRIQQMIQNSPDLINAVPQGGMLPLRNAARNGWLKVAAFLLDHGAEINRSQGWSPLHDAAESGNRAMVELLLNRGAEVNAHDSEGNTALHHAAEHGFLAVTTVLLAAHAKVDALNNNQETPLYLAAQNGRSVVVQVLLKARANANVKDHHGRTPLRAAAILGSSETIKALLAAAANPNLPDDSGRTPLGLAADAASPEIVKMLLEAKADANAGRVDAPLLCAILKHDLVSAGLLLQANADPNAKGDFDLVNPIVPTTPMSLAISTHQLPMVDLLLKFNADPNDPKMGGDSPLFQALSDPNILISLLKAGAKVDATSHYGGQWTPLCAATQIDPKDVQILLQYGANPNFRTVSDLTPLHYAAYQKADRKVFELLLAAKADPNVRGIDGKTPLGILKDRMHEVNMTAEGKAMIEGMADLLRQHGALDKLPDWDHLTISRPATGFSHAFFQKGTNNWNQFSLLELILNDYPSHRGVRSGIAQDNIPMPFPDLTRIMIVRPQHDSTNETRIAVNLLNTTNEIDCSKNVPLDFGDVVQIPERDHALSDTPVGLTDGQRKAMADCLTGIVQLLAHGQKIELAIYPSTSGSSISAVLNQPEAQKILLASSDLLRVKVSRTDPQSGRKRVLVVKCNAQMKVPSWPNEQIAFLNAGRFPDMLQEQGYDPNDLWLRNGDVIEVPEKP